MSDIKKTHNYDNERHTNSETAHLLSKDRRNKEKSKQKNYSRADERRIARVEHTNGSTPKNRM